MKKKLRRSEDIQAFIIENVTENPKSIARLTATEFAISRQAVNRHLRQLVSMEVLSVVGRTRKIYSPVPSQVWKKLYHLTPSLEEDIIWREDISPLLQDIGQKARDIWYFAFTEMFNNTIDHAQGQTVIVQMVKNAAYTEMSILDDGVGIFKKIKAKLGLLDERHALLELAKGKFTTDPQRHSGEGIFFTSRAVDKFSILSGQVYFTHDRDQDWLLENYSTTDQGTIVVMRLANQTKRELKKVFAEFISDDDSFAFAKTIVPVELVRYGNDNLISRSQAKRLLVRVDLFKNVVFDFSGVDMIGQAFADEIFRVFARQHPEIKLQWVNANAQIERMIKRARALENMV